MFAASKTDSLVVDSGYQISRSLRFNAPDTTYLARTPSVASNRRTYTWSGWVKKSNDPADRRIFEAGISNSNVFWMGFGNAGATDQLTVQDYNGSFQIQLSSTPVFRDPSAWYHVVVAVDTTQATSTDRVKIYINAVQITSFVGGNNTFPSPNYETRVNQTVVHDIGGSSVIGGSAYFNGYITEVNFIDGQQLPPSSFGETNAQTGVWQPKAFVGTYGTNGFYLNFSDNSNTTAATLGKDYSGNGNNWTPNGFSVSSGVNNDSMVDVPTPYGVDTGAGGEVRGNYCTINPLDGVGTATIAEGNLKFTNLSSATFRGTIGVTGSSGKWYWEFTQQTAVSSGTPISYGISTLQGSPSHSASVRAAYYYTDLVGRFLVVTINGAQTSISIATAIAINEVLQFAYDSDSGKVWVGKSGVWSDSTGGTTGNPATGANPTYTFASVDQPMAPTLDHAGVAYTATLNCGQRAFAYTAPSGFKALCTQNLPTPTIGATSTTLANTFFAPALYTGNGSTQSITDVGFQPDFTWLKCRSNPEWHSLFDSVRGVLKDIRSNSSNAEITATATLTAFNSNGFSLGADPDGYGTNTSGRTYVAWNWKANGAGSSNTAGSITSTVSANTTSGFSVVTYTGTGTSGQTVGHGLGVKPAFIIVKKRSTTGGWVCWQQALTGGSEQDRYIYLNTTAASGTTTSYWGTSGITSTTFGVWASGGDNNESGSTFVAYCFAPVAGYSAFGSYTGNGSADGPFVFTGMRPAFVLTKRTDSAGDWQLMDISRSTYNVAEVALFPNATSADTAGYSKDFLSNGFKIRDAGGSLNASGGTYIFIAFASNPFKYSLAR